MDNTTIINAEVQALRDELARMQAENAKLKGEKKERALSFKVSPKGAISVYGLNKFPVTLYAKQWAKLFGCQEDITKFIALNAATIKHDKVDATVTAPVVEGSGEAA